MNKSRAHLALSAMAASLSLLAACSKGDDTPPPADSGMTTAPDAAPAQGTAPESSPAPGTSTQ
ncbi:hypothetical protein H0A71_13385 [Alcaligenaceae bacterium]|nr:hypothetical protein [Alcaligenaceae bacterium]